MAAQAQVCGHDVEFDGVHWRFSDTGEIVNHERACSACGRAAVRAQVDGAVFMVDACIAPLVQALNDAGMATVASCCGHTRRPGSIILTDGREVIVARNFDEARRIDRLFPVNIYGENTMNENAASDVLNYQERLIGIAEERFPDVVSDQIGEREKTFRETWVRCVGVMVANIELPSDDPMENFNRYADLNPPIFGSDSDVYKLPWMEPYRPFLDAVYTAWCDWANGTTAKTIEATASLQYALRNPGAAEGGDEALMRKAADRIDELEGIVDRATEILGRIVQSYPDANAATSAPFWGIVARAGFTGRYVLHAGIWFTRDAAEQHLKTCHCRFPKSARVYCFSGYDSEHWKELWNDTLDLLQPQPAASADQKVEAKQASEGSSAA